MSSELIIWLLTVLLLAFGAVIVYLVRILQRIESAYTWPSRYQAWKEGRAQIMADDVIAGRISLDELIPPSR